MTRLRIGATLLIATLITSDASAIALRAPSIESLYVKARAAEIEGDAQLANEGFARLLKDGPVNITIAERAYRQAIAAGDEPLALRAARLLDGQKTFPPDARLLLAIDAIRTHDWTGARAEVDRLEQEKLFAFMAPMLRAWIALGAKDGDPLAILDQARTIQLAQPYYAEQRALLLIAMGRVEEGVAVIRGAKPAGIESAPASIRLIAADALAGANQRDRALALISGDQPAFAIARARIAAGRRLPFSVDGPPSGIAVLLVGVAADFGRQRLTPIAFILARFATFLEPADANGWLLTANLLAAMDRQELALKALSSIAHDDPLDPAARALRIGVLSEMGNNDEALAEATKAAESDQGFAAWARVGGVYFAMQKPADAAVAFRKAIAAAEAEHAPADTLWPLNLQLGTALDLAGDWPGAKAALQRALKLAPDQAVILNQLGYSQIIHGENINQASALIEHASRLRPDDPAITDSLGWVHYLRGQVSEALPLLEKAAAGDAAEPTINEHLGDAYWSVGRRYEARYAWRAALVTAADKDKGRISSKIDFGLTPATAAP